MIILDATLSNIHRDRDFGRIEAEVALVIKQPGHPVRTRRLKTSVLAKGENLRKRLIQNASQIAMLMPQETGTLHNVA